jgi:hypothetical protein
MNQIKRQRNFIQSVDTEMKKFRSKLDVSHSPSRSCLENLSNELFYEIFEYLDDYDVYNVFSNLNIRFQNMVLYSSMPIKINLCAKSESTLEYRCRHFIIPNKHRILSLHLRDESLINQFYKHCLIDSSFNRLESIVLSGLTDHQLLRMLFYLNSLPRLLSLTIQMEEDYYYNLDDIYRLIFSLPSLRYNKLSLSSCDDVDIALPNIINEKVCFITHLVIDYLCTINQLISLLSHTPQLCHLTCERLIESDEDIKKDLPITLSRLTYFSVGECQVEFDEFELFIKKISSPLQVLRVNISWNPTYLDADRWERLIKKHMPHLNKFHFCYDQYINDDFRVNPGYNFINRFTSPFWFERKWFCELKIVRGDLIFLVHPFRYIRKQILFIATHIFIFRKEWFNYYEYIKMDTHANQCNIDNCSIQLTVDGQSTAERTRLFIGKMNSSCVAVRFTHLNINCNGMSIGTLIEIIRLLPNLDSLKISSLTNLQLNALSVEDTKKHLFVSAMNKITKVKLDKFTEEKHIQLLINFCPRIQYLEVDCVSNTNLGMFMKYILVNQMVHIPNLCSVCVNIPNASETMIQDLAMTIKLKTLVDNYTIQRIGDMIFLHRKLL